MKRLTLLLTGIIICLMANGREVTEQQALEKAQRFLQGKQLMQKSKARSIRRVAQISQSHAYYVFNVEENGGFVIVSADDRTEEILGYSDTGTFDTSNMPDNVKSWLGYYEQVIRSLGDLQIQTAPRRVERANIAPLVKTTWGQSTPYNSMCPFNCMTGCVATAMAQVINYHQWPVTTLAPIPEYMTSSQRFTVDELPVTTFDWEKMDNQEVSKLMLYCGASVQMDYGYRESGASSFRIAPALKKYFGYDQNTRYVLRSSYSIDDWEEMIYSELAANRAVIYDGTTIDVGHEFICDGYKDGLFHINWGWDGNYDGYFSLSILNPNATGTTGGSSTNDGYSMRQGAVVGIQKPTGLSPEKNSLSVIPLSAIEEDQIETVVMNTSHEVFFGEIGLALYKDSSLEKILVEQHAELNNAIGSVLRFNIKDVTGQEEGNYRVLAVYRNQGEAEWVPCQGTSIHYIEIIISEGIATAITHPAVNLTVNSLTFTEGKRPDILQDIIANITNNSTDEYNGNLFLFVNGNLVSAAGSFIRAGETAGVIFRYSPIQGNLNMQVRDEKGNVLYEEVVPVFNEGEVENPFYNLADNRRIFGYYTSHDYDLTIMTPVFHTYYPTGEGIGRFGYLCGAVKFTEQKMASVKGSKITHIRFALRDTETVRNVKVFIGSNLDNRNLLEQDIPTIHLGWNTVKLDSPITIDGKELCVGVQFNNDQTFFPCASTHVDGEALRGSYFVKSEGEQSWGCYEASTNSSLCIQCLVEGDIPDYDVELTRQYDYPYYYNDPQDVNNLNKYVKQGSEVYDNISFIAKNNGKKVAEKYVVAWQIDDRDIHYEPEIAVSSNSDYGSVSYTLPSDLAVGQHEVAIFVASVNGVTMNYSRDRAIKIKYKVWSQDIGRQKALLDLQGGQTNLNTYWDIQSITKAKAINENIAVITTLFDPNDVALNYPYQIFEAKGWSWLAINRDARPGQTYFRMHTPTNDFDVLSRDISIASRAPSFATVNIAASVNAQKELEIKVSGIRNEEFIKLFDESRLTVALTEDGVLRRLRTTESYEEGMVDDFPYDGVLRRVLSSVWGDEITWESDSYEKTYIVHPPSEWDLKNVKVVAFLSEKEFNYTNACDVDVMNCNDFALNSIDLSELNNLPVVITAKSYTRKYGEANPTFEYTVEGAELDGTPEITCEATVTSPVGTYPIIIKKGSISNFNDTYINGTLTITKTPLNIAAGTYTKKQGDQMPEFTLTYTGFKNNETKDVLTKLPTVSCKATEASAPDEYPVTVSGAEARNYKISYTDGKLVVTEADLVTITAKSDFREYGEANPTFEYTVEGAELDGTPEITCEATVTSPVGTYDISVKQGTIKNYNVTYVVGTLTITKAPLAVKVDNATREQGKVNPAFAIRYSGWKNGEDESVLTIKPIATTEATVDSPAGEYTIIVSGGEAQNYDLSYANGILTVTEASGIMSISVEHPVDVYDLQGSKVRSRATTLKGLAKGVYIVNGSKVIVK